MANPLVDQGVLNRIAASISVPGNTALNVTADFLNRNGISMRLEGSASAQLPTLTGAVQSPNPYMLVTVTINLLKPQSLCALYKAAFENDVLLGDVTVRPDVTEGLDPFDFVNCALDSVPELSFAGEDAGFPVTFHGFWIINAALYS